MKKIDIRDIRSEEILAVNRGENTLFQRRENLSKHTSYARERMQYDARWSRSFLCCNRSQMEPKGSFQKISSVTAKICLLPESPFLPGLLLTVVYQRKQPIL